MGGGIIKFSGILLSIIIGVVVVNKNWRTIFGFNGIHEANDCKALQRCLNTRPLNLLFQKKEFKCKTDKISTVKAFGTNACDCVINGGSSHQIVHCS